MPASDGHYCQYYGTGPGIWTAESEFAPAPPGAQGTPSGPLYSGSIYGGLTTSSSGQNVPSGPPCGTPTEPTCGDPITIGTGNVFEAVTDYETAGPNRLAFARYYNSQAASATFATTLGSHWRSTYDRYLRITATTVSAERADGQVLSFILKAGVWTGDTDVDVKLAHTGSTWVLTDVDDTVETYTDLGTGEALLTAVRARSGYTRKLSYNSSNQLVSVTDSYNRSLKLSYESGLLETLTTPDALIFSFGYNSSGAKAGILDRLVSVAYSTTPQTHQTYVYEDSVFGLPFALTGIIDESGNRFATWTYDAGSRGVSSQHAGRADLVNVMYNANGSRTVTNGLGQPEVYKFATLQGVPKVIEIDRLATTTTHAATRKFTYDANGYMASSTDWNGNLTTYVNDTHGQPTTINEAVGTTVARTTTTTTTYHPTFHLPVQIVTPGLMTKFTRWQRQPADQERDRYDSDASAQPHLDLYLVEQPACLGKGAAHGCRAADQVWL